MTSTGRFEGQSNFAIFLRTGLRFQHQAGADVEVKFNPWHDPDDGKFTFKGQGSYFAGEGSSGADGARRSGGGRGGGGGGGWGEGPKAASEKANHEAGRDEASRVAAAVASGVAALRRAFGNIPMNEKRDWHVKRSEGRDAIRDLSGQHQLQSQRLRSKMLIGVIRPQKMDIATITTRRRDRVLLTPTWC